MQPLNKVIEKQFQAFARQRGLQVEFSESMDGLPQLSLYSDRKRHRYAFATWWNDHGPVDLWIGLNPGTGDTEGRRRPTLERCIARSRAAGIAGLLIANLFAARSKAPGELAARSDAVGAHNPDAVKMLCRMADRTIVCWGGRRGLVRAAAASIAPLLDRPLCLGQTAAGQPRHPLYVRREAGLEAWPSRSVAAPARSARSPSGPRPRKA